MHMRASLRRAAVVAATVAGWEAMVEAAVGLAAAGLAVAAGLGVGGLAVEEGLAAVAKEEADWVVEG